MTPLQSSLVHKTAPFEEGSANRYPTIILLHGRGANEDDLLGLVPYLDPRFFVIAARAPFPFPYGGHTWYEMHEVGTPEPGQFEESCQRLKQFIRDIKEHYPVDADRLFFLGFSMGTVMSYAHTLTHPGDVAGVVAHSGYIPEDTSLKFLWDRISGKRFFVAHGKHDPVIGVEFGRRAQELLSKARAEIHYKEYDFPHTMSEESVNDCSRWLTQNAFASNGS